MTALVENAAEDPFFDEFRVETPEILKNYNAIMKHSRYRLTAVRKWRGIVHSIILWLRLYQYHSSQVRQILRFFSDSDLLTDAGDEDEESLLFSVSSFRPNKQARVNPETLDIMRVDPASRLPSQIRPIEAGLRGYEAFRQYPAHILRRIAEKAWFQVFDKHSVIVREGDYPMYYYFIIYGSAMVTIIDQEQMMARTVATLNRGDSFGELAILHSTKRASTVIAREKCGLMMLEDRDYLDIFMHGGVAFLDTEFVKSHVMFRGFQLDTLKENPQLVKLNYFNAGVVVVEDTRVSHWVFLVISGKATVQMAVHKSALRHQDTDVEPQEVQDRRQLLADYKEHKIGHRTILRRNWRQHLSKQEKLAKTRVYPGHLELRQLAIPRCDQIERQLSRIGRENTRLQRDSTLPQLAKAYFSAPPAIEESSSSSKTDSKEPQEAKVTYVAGRNTVIGKRTLATDLNREYYEQLQAKLWLGELEDRAKLKYLPVQVLEKGMVFGITDQFFENQPPLRLMSNGCELLCIRKELYLENAGEITLFHLANTLRPYPSEKDVLGKNKEVKAWASRKAACYRQTLLDKASCEVDIHSARSRFPRLSEGD